MHILLVSQYFFPETFRVNDLVQGLLEQGHRVTVFTGIPNYPAGKFFLGYSWKGPLKETYHGATVYRCPLIPRGNGGGLRLALNYLSFAALGCLTIPFFCRERYDAIFVYQLSPVTAALPGVLMKLLRRVPLVHYVQDSWPESLVATGAIRSPLILGAMSKLVGAIYSVCDLILVQSRLFVDHVVKVGGSSEKVTYFPNWAEDFYVPSAQGSYPEVAGEFPPGFVILFAGNLGKAQSLETILEAAEHTREFPDIHWVLVGDGRERVNFETELRARQLSDRVHLLGRREPEQMPSYFAEADVLLVTLRDEEIFAMTVPSKVQTYMACERPILGALNGEGASVIEESGCGKSCPAGDGKALAALAIEMSLSSPEERTEMGRRGGDYCKTRFGRQSLLDQLESFLLELTARA